MSLLAFVLLNFRGRSTLTKYPQKSPVFRSFDWVWRTVGSKRQICYGSCSHTQISRKQPLPFLSAQEFQLGASLFYLPRTAGFVGDVTVGHHFVASAWTNTCTLLHADPHRPRAWKHLLSREVPQMRGQLLLNSPPLLRAIRRHFCLSCM